MRSSKNILFIFLILGLFASCASENNDKESRNGTNNSSSASSGIGFSKIPAKKTGIYFQNKVVESPKSNYYTYQYLYNGGGVAIGDLDNDGLQDIYFTANFGGNKLYKNKGDFQFEDVSATSGTQASEWSSGVTLADVNADGLLDIYVCRSGKKSANKTRNLLFINRGNMQFEEKAEAYGIADEGHSTQAAFFDFDLDGDLDLYVMNHPVEFKVPIQKRRELEKNPTPRITDHFYLNEGGKFIDQSNEVGVLNYGQGLGLAISDVNNDGYPDVYVANDYAAPDFLYVNNKNGKFVESIQAYTNHIPMYAMGCDMADINNDGWEDVMVAEMLAADYQRSKTNMAPMNPEQFQARVEMGWHHQYMRNTLQINNGTGSFSDIAQMAGVDKTDWSWSVLLADFDNDGWRDLYVTNGFKRDVLDKDFVNKSNTIAKQSKGQISFDQVYSMLKSTKLPNYIFRNKNGLLFEDKSADWSIDDKTFSNGAAYGDLDNDGDLDLVINNINDNAGVYQNQTGENSLRLKLKGSEKNPFSYGATARLFDKENRLLSTARLQTTRGYQSSVEPLIHFGFGNKNLEDLKLEIKWPDHEQVLVVDKLEKGLQEYSLSSAAGSATAISSESSVQFSERKESVFTHKEVEVNDYKREILLPHKMSQQGPFLAVGDVNGDDLEDFWIGGARNQAGAIFLQDKNGGFSKANNPVFDLHKESEDMGAAFFDLENDGDLDLYVASGSNEAPSGDESFQDRLYINDGKGNFSAGTLPRVTISTSCVIADDIDGDGDTDLFVGGRLVPGAYPKPTSSFVFLNMNGELKDLDPSGKSALKSIGMVTTAAWIDLNGDKYKDLIVAGEWMSPRFLLFEKGVLTDRTDAYAAADYTGWWNKIVLDDIDGDRQPEIIAGNLGLNYKYKASQEEPFHVYAGDFDKNGTQDIVLAMESEQGKVPIRGLQCTSEQMPAVKSKFRSYESFAKANITDILGANEIKDNLHYSAKHFASSIIDHNGTKFVAEALPLEAQLSTVNGIVSHDFDGDGVLDLLIAGNMFQSEIETSRADASVGYFFKGIKTDQAMKYEAVPPHSSQFHVPGDVKDMKMLRKTANGNPIILVTNNNGPLQIFDLVNK